MKILYLIPTYEPAWAFGGTVTAVSQLCRAFADKGVDITVYTTDADGKGGHLDVPLSQPVNLGGVKVWYFHCDFLKKKAFYSRALSKHLRKTVKKFNLVHVSSIWQWHQWIVYRICTKSNIPYIVSPHASLGEWSFKKVGNRLLKEIYWNLFGAQTIKSATAIHFLCEGERETSKNFTFSTPSFIVSNGIRCVDFAFDQDNRNLLRNKYNIPDSKIVLLFLGRIHPKKNIYLILEAMFLIKDLSEKIYFFIVGPVENNDYYEKLKSLSNKYHLNSRVIWHPSVNNKEVKKFYFMSDLMVLPSKSEGISMAVTESLASSLPVLISNRVANYYEIEKDKAGIIVEPNIESVTEALKKILTNPSSLKEMSQNARKSAMNRYDINKVASLMLKAYEDVLTGGRRPECNWAN